MQIFKKATIPLWLWIFLAPALWSRQFLDAPFRPAPGSANARLFHYPEIAALEYCAAIILLIIISAAPNKPNWIVTGACAATWILAFYHFDNYSVGIDFMLMFAVMAVFMQSLTWKNSQHKS